MDKEYTEESAVPLISNISNCTTVFKIKFKIFNLLCNSCARCCCSATSQHLAYIIVNSFSRRKFIGNKNFRRVYLLSRSDGLNS